MLVGQIYSYKVRIKDWHNAFISFYYANNYTCLLQGVPAKTHKVLHKINFKPFTYESQCLHQNPRKRL